MWIERRARGFDQLSLSRVRTPTPLRNRERWPGARLSSLPSSWAYSFSNSSGSMTNNNSLKDFALSVLSTIGTELSNEEYEHRLGKQRWGFKRRT